MYCHQSYFIEKSMFFSIFSPEIIDVSRFIVDFVISMGGGEKGTTANNFYTLFESPIFSIYQPLTPTSCVIWLYKLFHSEERVLFYIFCWNHLIISAYCWSDYGLNNLMHYKDHHFINRHFNVRKAGFINIYYLPEALYNYKSYVVRKKRLGSIFSRKLFFFLGFLLS
jgi:hypothetical protein